MGFRQYDPVIGRFLSVDPLFEMFEDLTPYQYSFNNPIGWHDPTGLAPEKEKGKMKDKLLIWLIETTFIESNPLKPEYYLWSATWIDRRKREMETDDIDTRLGLYNCKEGGIGGLNAGLGTGSSSGYGGGGGTICGEKSTGNGIVCLGVASMVNISLSGLKIITSPTSSNKNNHHNDGYQFTGQDFYKIGCLDVTQKFDAQLEYTKQFFTQKQDIFNVLQAISPSNFQGIIFLSKYIYFASQVAEYRPFDIKHITYGPHAFSFKALNNHRYGIYNGEYMTPGDFGNYCVGYAAKCFGIPLETVIKCAGLSQIFYKVAVI